MTAVQFADRVFQLAHQNGWVTPRGAIRCPNKKTLNREKVCALFDLCERKNIPPTAANSADRKSLNIQTCCFELLRELAETAYNQ